MAARTMLLHGSTIAQTAAQYGLNAAMLGSPVMWVVGGVMLLIGALYGGVAAYNELTDSSVSATGIITGAMGGLFAFVGNGFILLWNIIGEAATFLENVFIHPVEVVKFLFLGMAESVLSYISQMMQGIQDTVNKIPGVEVDITSGINGLISDIQSKSQSIIDNTQWKEYDPIAYMNIGEWAAKGYSLGANFNPFGSGSSFDMDDWLSNTDFATDISDIAGDVSGIQKSVSLADEDIKSLVDMAERRYVNNINLTAQSPVITVQGQNTGDSAADRRALADAIKDILVEQSSSASMRSTARTK